MKKSLVVLSVVCLPAAHGGPDPEWQYSGPTGPQNWGQLSASYKACSSGRGQSPIDIAQGKDVQLQEIQFNYRAAGQSILNNGHTVQVAYAPGSSISIDGHAYELKQFHFHAPSENLIHGKSFPAEAHFVHADKKGQLAVVAVMIERGEPNALLSQAWAKLPERAGEQVELASAVSAEGLLPRERDYYKFPGSLTTPPCTEGVTWMVMKQPVTASREQIERLTHALHHANNRPVQPLNARVILE